MKRILSLGCLLAALFSPPASAILDVNDNTMSDVWERAQNGGDLFTNMLPGDDDDNDGWTNEVEAAAGANPKSSLAPDGFLRPEVNIIHDVPIDFDENGIIESNADVATIAWPVIAGKIYTLLHSANLAEGSWEVVTKNLSEANGIRTCHALVTRTDGVPPSDPSMFWRIKIEDVDSDNDGLTDAEEREIGTDPSNADTDDDGLPDKFEVIKGLEPRWVMVDVNANGLPDEWELANAGKFGVYPPILNTSIMAGREVTAPIRLWNDTAEAVAYTIAISGNSALARQDAVSGSVAYVWEDISETGTHLELTSSYDNFSEPIPGGFEFTLYGSHSTNVFVSSNGFLALRDNPFGTSTPQNLPSTTAYASMIAPWWDDLDPSISGDIYYKKESNRLIVQYENVARHTGTGTYTFQVILFSNGEIEYRYKEITGSTASATVGVQDFTKRQGGRIATTASFPVSELAVRIIRLSEYFNCSPLSGTVAAHSIATVEGAFNSLTLHPALYTAQIDVTPAGEENAPRTSLAQLKVLADSDSDGMPDEWEVLHGLEPRVNDASGDPDCDGYTNLEEFTYGTFPEIPSNVTDADKDGMWDRWESHNGLNPAIDDHLGDADADGVLNIVEFQKGTNPQSDDSDSDLMGDAWEIANGLNPLFNDAAQDPDSDGLTNLWEYQHNINPHVRNDTADIDGDGMLDAWELVHGLLTDTNDSALDPDNDGLTNLREFQIHTDPQDSDSDADSLPDGWEETYHLDPNIGIGENGQSGDPDYDGASNFVEWQNGTDPRLADTDGDGTNDGQEIGQGSNATSAADEGQAPAANQMEDVAFSVGDPAGSSSEAWCMEITPQGPDDSRPTFRISSDIYGEITEQSLKLWKNNKYEVVLKHLRTDPTWLEDEGEPDYDRQAQIDGKPTSLIMHDWGDYSGDFFMLKDHWLVDNRDGLLGAICTDYGGNDRTIGKKAVLIPLAVKLWETSNKANQIFNKTKKDDDAVNLAVIEKEGDAVYCLPRNNVYVVADATDNKFKVALNMNMPPDSRDRFLCAAYDGNTKVSGSDRTFPTAADQAAQIEISSPSGAVVKEYEIRAGYDANANTLLDESEVIRLLVYTRKDINGTPVDQKKYATVKGITYAMYEANYGAIAWFVNFGAVSLGVPHAHALLSRFLNGNFDGINQTLQPSAVSEDEEFDAFKNATPSDSCFSEWLTHNSGAWFSDDGKVTDFPKLTWLGNTSFSDLLARTNPIAVKTLITNPVVLDPRTGLPIGDPTTWVLTNTGNALRLFYEGQVRSAADAELAGKGDWDWYFSPWYACPDACGTVMPTQSGASWPLSTVQAGNGTGENGWPLAEEIQTILLSFFGDQSSIDNYDASLAVGRARAKCRYQFQVRREPKTFGGYENVVRKILCQGTVEDLYDFNFEDGDPPEDARPRKAATIQIGSGAGRASISMPPSGRIYRTKWIIDFECLDPF